MIGHLTVKQKEWNVIEQAKATAQRLRPELGQRGSITNSMRIKAADTIDALVQAMEQLQEQNTNVDATCAELEKDNHELLETCSQLRAEMYALRNEVKAMECDDVGELRKEVERLREVLLYTRSVLPNERWADDSKRMIDAAMKHEQAEPVMFAWKRDDGTYYDASGTEHSKGMHPLYAATKHEQAEPVLYQVTSEIARGVWTTVRDVEEYNEYTVTNKWKGRKLYAAPTGKQSLQVEQEQAEPVTDDFIHKVVRSTQPHLDATCKDWKKEFDECKYWLEAAHAINPTSKQEPVAWASKGFVSVYLPDEIDFIEGEKLTPLYAAPKQEQAELLKQALEALNDWPGAFDKCRAAIKAIKQHLGEA
jgi:hypothetical protein